MFNIKLKRKEINGNDPRWYINKRFETKRDTGEKESYTILDYINSQFILTNGLTSKFEFPVSLIIDGIKAGDYKIIESENQD